MRPIRFKQRNEVSTGSGSDRVSSDVKFKVFSNANC
jgi:hypothetical protein